MKNEDFYPADPLSDPSCVGVRLFTPTTIKHISKCKNTLHSKSFLDTNKKKIWNKNIQEAYSTSEGVVSSNSFTVFSSSPNKLSQYHERTSGVLIEHKHTQVLHRLL